MRVLDVQSLQSAAGAFARELHLSQIQELFGVTDGKAVGTFVESALHDFLESRFEYTRGNAALGVDFPDQNADLKVTSIRRPQSSCPYRNAEQKVYGLGYHLLVLIYHKLDDHDVQAAVLRLEHAFFVDAKRTADFQTTRGLRDIIARDGNVDDVIAFLEERRLPLDDLGQEQLATRILSEPPVQGYLTISNALQWRLQYRRLITLTANSDAPDGVSVL